MAFRVAARTILHLGAELISSDAVAFYELIKNAFDAGSPEVRIKVVTRCTKAHEILRELIEGADSAMDRESRRNWRALMQEAQESVDRTAPGAQEFSERLGEVSSLREATAVLREANYIEISDDGHGMSTEDLNGAYLTIGTTSRLVEKQRMLREEETPEDQRPILGEKGVGRLSVMRLGMMLKVTTSRAGLRYWNNLIINWNAFAEGSDGDLGGIAVAPVRGEEKEDTSVHGTTLRISALNEKWSRGKLAEIASTGAAKFIDPFAAEKGFKIWLWYNGSSVTIPRLNPRLFDHAHAIVQARLERQPVRGGWEPVLSGTVNYVLRGHSRDFCVRGEHLYSAAGSENAPAEESAVRATGPFSAKFYWFNRRALQALEDVGLGDKQEAANEQKRWAGGLMLFRDGFRVVPYGSPDDDWLDLDRKAFASGGYKVNRRQVVGKVDITARDNPALRDQTNREGLCECDEKRVLVNLLKHVLEVQFRAYINGVDKEVKARQPVDIVALRDRVVSERKRAKAAIKLLVTRFPAVKKDAEIVPIMEEALERISEATEELDRVAKNLKEAESKLIHLAAQGMLVEILAHELWRATSHALETVAGLDRGANKPPSPAAVRTLASQLKTLQKRLKILDPTNTTARQVKVEFDLVELLDDILKGHQAQFDRHNIAVALRVEPNGSGRHFEVRMVRGMVVQVFENLLSNSVYWLKARKKRSPGFAPEIQVVFDKVNREIRVTDNGPGVEPERREEIFAPFVTTKPSGEGKGLGLYIAREISKYHGAEIYLDEEPSFKSDNLNTFILKLP